MANAIPIILLVVFLLHADLRVCAQQEHGSDGLTPHGYAAACSLRRRAHGAGLMHWRIVRGFWAIPDKI
jgi:hypothetical protein